MLAANLLGALAFAWVLGHTGIFEGRVRQEFAALSRAALAGGFGLHFLRGIFAGWLIALIVWLMPGAEHGRLGIILILTYLVVSPG